MIWELFAALRRLCIRAEEACEDRDTAAERQDAALCVILAVQSVEVFLNIYFRVLISEPAFAHASERISADLRKTRFGLDQKIKEWPLVAFGKGLSLDKGAGQRFVALKDLRHTLMHFTSSHETFEASGVTINGLADTSAYESLSAESAAEALRTAEAFLCEMFALRGAPSNELPHHLHSWTGKPPIFVAA